MSNIIDSIQLSGVTYTLSGSGGGNATVELTQAEYDALVSAGTVDNSTFYIITDATPIDVSTYVTSGQMTSAITSATSGKVNTSAVVSSVTSASTDSQIPTAKAVYDAIPTGGTGGSYSAGTNIDITNDTISCTLPITANTAVVKSISIGQNSSLSNRCDGSIVVGYNCSLSNSGADGAAAMGWYCKANKDFSFAQGNNINANNAAEHSVGQYNVSNSGSSTSAQTLFSVGNGTANNARHNAFEIRQNGDIYLTKDGVDIKLQDNLGGTASSAITSGDTNPVQGGAIYDKFDEVEQVTARALNELNEKINALIEANEVVARALNDLNDRITELENG